MVARLVRDQEAMGSNPVTSTKTRGGTFSRNKKGTAKTAAPFLIAPFGLPLVGLVTGQFEIMYHSLRSLPLRCAWDESSHSTQKKHALSVWATRAF